MGFIVKGTIFRLEFAEGHLLHGSTIRVRSASVGKLLQLMALAEELKGDQAPDDKKVDELFTMFSERLVSWDLQEEPETEGAIPRDIPCDKAGLYELDLGPVLSIVFAWIDGAADISIPLERSSNGGGRSEAPPMTMETLEAPLLN